MWCEMAWYGMVWYDVVWCGAVWCGVVWSGMVWCGMIYCTAFIKVHITVPHSQYRYLIKFQVHPTCAYNIYSHQRQKTHMIQ